jgi:hypothetical protein
MRACWTIPRSRKSLRIDLRAFEHESQGSCRLSLWVVSPYSRDVAVVVALVQDSALGNQSASGVQLIDRPTSPGIQKLSSSRKKTEDGCPLTTPNGTFPDGFRLAPGFLCGQSSNQGWHFSTESTVVPVSARQLPRCRGSSGWGEGASL